MREFTTKFGENAGKIWSILEKKGCLKDEELLEITKMSDNDFHSGVGWLARENKIAEVDNSCYELKETNLEMKIGSHAGRIWKILDIWGDVDYDSIKRLSDLKDEQIHAALGWLARENKIVLDEKNRFNLK